MPKPPLKSNPSSIEFDVIANPATKTLTVIGTTGNAIEVCPKTKPTIILNLKLGQGQEGSFNDVEPWWADSGFTWTCPPPPGSIFHGFVRPTGSHITLVDENNTPGDPGWTYKLRAVVNGVPCETNPGNSRVPGDPSIKNR